MCVPVSCFLLIKKMYYSLVGYVHPRSTLDALDCKEQNLTQLTGILILQLTAEKSTSPQVLLHSCAKTEQAISATQTHREGQMRIYDRNLVCTEMKMENLLKE